MFDDLLPRTNDISQIEPKKLPTLDEHKFNKIREEIIFLLKEVDTKRNNYYHNTCHSLDVEQRIILLAKEYNLEQAITQALRIAALFHDYDHCGSTIRNDESGMTNEEVAAKEADKYLTSKNLPQRQIATIKNMIIATTFGTSNIQPKTLFEKLLCFADVGGFVKPFEDWIIETSNYFKELPRNEVPNNYALWVENEIKFLNWAESRMPIDVSFEWKKKLEETKNNVKNSKTLFEKYILPITIKKMP